MFERILVPTDGSVGCDQAIDHAVALATVTDATLHALYVVDETVFSAYSADEYVHEHEGLENALEEVGEDAIEVVRTRAADAGVDLVTAVLRGRPDDTILDYVGDHGIDLVVMGSKRRSGDYRQLLGSVTERVSRHVDVPVTIVKTPVE